jgi:hypothetical protein
MILTLDTLHRYARTFEGSPCMLWTQGTTNTGYPQARIGPKSQLVQRHVFTALMGRVIPRGSRIRPSCGERLCISPACLKVVRCSQIIRETWRDGKRSRPTNYTAAQAHAVRQGWARLTADQVAAIRARPGDSVKHLAAEFGVSKNTVYRVRRGESWRDTYVPPASVFDLGRAAA